MQNAQGRPVFYGWYVVAATILLLLVAAGVRSVPGIMLVPIMQDTGWDRSAVSLAISLGLIVFGLGSPFAGGLIGRFGPRRVAVAGIVLMALSSAISAAMREIWQMDLVWGALSGLSTGLGGAVIGASVANRWFYTKRGLVSGIFGAATSAGQLIFTPALTGLVLGLGWRTTSLIVAGIAAIIVVPVWLIMRDEPADKGLLPYGAPASNVVAPPARSQSPTGSVMSGALRSPTFWMLAGTFFVCGFSSNGIIGTHFMAYAADCGLGALTAAGLLSVMGVMNFAGTMGSGWLTDRVDPRKLLLVYYVFRGASLLLLPLFTEEVGLSFFMILFGLDYIATVPPTQVLVADNFGRKNVGLVYGWVFCAHQLGAALSSALGGAIREQFGAYGFAFAVTGVMAIVAGVVALRITRPAPLAFPSSG
ncbi:MAG TPA: MFS transporter [Thermoflexales bacterium]|nr:MFS transporter [Thermoflexales bacterium]